MSVKRLAILVFLIWEAWWAYEFISAPLPDEEMRTVFAILMGVAVPMSAAVVVGVFLLARKLVRHKPVEKPQ